MFSVECFFDILYLKSNAYYFLCMIKVLIEYQEKRDASNVSFLSALFIF